MELKFNEWESNLLGKSCYSLAMPSLTEDMAKEAGFLLQELSKHEKDYMVSARCSVQDVKKIQALESSGFKFIENYCEFETEKFSIGKTLNAEISVRAASFDDINRLKIIAKESLLNSRFHMDPLISHQIAAESRAQWVENGVKGRSEIVFVAEFKGKIAGFLCVKVKKDNDTRIGVIDLIASDKDVQRKGIGWHLILAFFDFCLSEKLDKALVGTQGHNRQAILLYEKAGFTLSNSFISLHCHQIKTERS